MLADMLPCYPFTNVMMAVTDRQDSAWHFRVSFGSLGGEGVCEGKHGTVLAEPSGLRG